MRLLHLGHPDLRRGAAAAQSRSERGRGARRARPQPVPLRRPQPHRARGAARGQGGRRHDTPLRRTVPATSASARQPERQSAPVAVAARSRPTASSRSAPARSRSARASSPRWRRSPPTSSTSSSRASAWSRPRRPRSPNEGVTSGSLSVRAFAARRCATSAPRRAPSISPPRRSGSASRPTASTSRTAPSSGPATCAPATGSWPTTRLLDARRHRRGRAKAGRRAPASPARRRPRLDLPDKVFGQPRFIHDLSLPGMLHGRVLRPPSPRRQARGARRRSRAARAGRRRRGARRQLRRRRRRDRGTPPRRRSRRCARPRPWGDGRDAARRGEPRGLAQEPAGRDHDRRCARGCRCRRTAGPHPAARTIRGRSSPMPRWRRPAPSRSGADDSVQVWSHCQGVYNLRADLALALALPPESIVVEHVEGAGCYGHNGADDVALDAVLLARAAQGPAGARAVVARGRAGLVAVRRRAWPSRSRPISTRRARSSAGAHDVWSNGHVVAARPRRYPTLLAACAARQALRALHRHQPAARERRRRRAQRRAALRLSRLARSPAIGC